MSEKKPFEYTYVSPGRKMTPEDLRAGDASSKQNLRSVIPAILWGLLSCLIFGLGLTCVLTWNSMIPGLLLGILGIAGMASAPAFYRYLVLRERKREDQDDVSSTAAHRGER